MLIKSLKWGWVFSDLESRHHPMPGDWEEGGPKGPGHWKAVWRQDPTRETRTGPLKNPGNVVASNTVQTQIPRGHAQYTRPFHYWWASNPTANSAELKTFHWNWKQTPCLRFWGVFGFGFLSLRTILELSLYLGPTVVFASVQIRFLIVKCEMKTLCFLLLVDAVRCLSQKAGTVPTFTGSVWE